MTSKEAEVQLRKTFINKNTDIIVQNMQNKLLDIILLEERKENDSPFLKAIIEKSNFFVDNKTKKPKYIIHFIIRGGLLIYDMPIQVNKKTWLGYKIFWENKFK